MKKILVLSILSILFFVACKNSNTAQKKEIPTFKMIKYYVRYIEQSKELQVEAKYYNENDSAFAMPNGVFLADFKLEAKNLPREGWMHRFIKRPAFFDSLYVFEYKYSDSYSAKDSVLFPKFDSFRLATPKISKKNGGLVTWNGAALDQEDGLTLLFEDAAGNHITNNHVGLTRGPKVEIRPDFLEALSKGKAILRVVHKKSAISKIGDTRYIKLTEYYRSPIEVEITD